MNILMLFYMTNAVLIIVHEIDSAYWREWKLFKLPGGINFFLVIHIPLVFLVLFGLLQLQQQTAAGYIISLILALAGIFAFIIHAVFIGRGNREFNTPVSLSILVAILAISITQVWLTVIAMLA
ncbi:MAG: DUF6713 family protein [Dehalococcoidia bacterium]